MPTTITSDGVAIHHSTVGAGPDVVLVHGLTDRSATWGPITGMLAERYRVTTLDLRGMGESGDADDYGSTTMVRDVEAVVAAVGIDDPLVIGHSLGGIVVTAYAATAPVRGTINLDQSLHLSGFQVALQQVESLLRDPASFPSVIQAVFDGLDGPVLAEAEHAALKAEIVGLRRQRQEVVLGVWDQVFSSTVGELDALMAQITADITTPYLSLEFIDNGPGYPDWLRALVPHALVESWIVPVDGGPAVEFGHYGHRLDPSRLVERVIAFDK